MAPAMFGRNRAFVRCAAEKVVLGRSMARPTPAISVDTNGDFADRKAEVNSSAMYIGRSFGDLTRADSIIYCAGARLLMPSNPDEPPGIS